VTEQKNVFTLSALQTLFFNLFSDDDYSYGHFLHDIAPDFSKVNSIIHFDLREPVYDTTIIHEHVHACSLFMRIVAKNIAEGGTGFLKSRQLKGIIGETEGKSDYDNAMLIDVDEMFTEYFTSLIVAKMLNDNYVIVRPEDENYDNIYRVGFPAMDVFFNNFLQEAKEFYINNDIQGLKNWMGKNNFKKFAKALGKFARLSPDNLADDWDWLDGDRPLSYIYANIESYGDRVNDSEYFSAMRDIKEVTDALVVKYKSNDDSDDSEPK